MRFSPCASFSHTLAHFLGCIHEWHNEFVRLSSVKWYHHTFIAVNVYGLRCHSRIFSFTWFIDARGGWGWPFVRLARRIRCFQYDFGWQRRFWVGSPVLVQYHLWLHFFALISNLNARLAVYRAQANRIFPFSVENVLTGLRVVNVSVFWFFNSSVYWLCRRTFIDNIVCSVAMLN